MSAYRDAAESTEILCDHVMTALSNCTSDIFVLVFAFHS